MAELAPTERLHFLSAGNGPKTLVLLHGFPETSWAWRNVMAPLAARGYRVIAPDNRGAGNSWRPLSGYDKRTMASDVRRLLVEHLSVGDPVVLVGHDLGLMIAYAYAQLYRESVSRLVLIDAPLPGTEVFRNALSDSRVWHFAFHGARDIAEFLIAGREHQYLKAFFDFRVYNPSGITDADLNHYASAMAMPGGIRGAVEPYRTFAQDATDNLDLLKRNGKLTIPVLAMGGSLGTFGGLVEGMLKEVAETVIGRRIPRTSHWIAEENPEGFIEALLPFVESQ
jgi:pimeloyl-ACP methyl ester carboxylesterase